MLQKLSWKIKYISLLVLLSISTIVGGLLLFPTHMQQAHADSSPSVNCDQQTESVPVGIGTNDPNIKSRRCKVTVANGYCLNVRSDHILTPATIVDCIPDATSDGTILVVCQTTDPQNTAAGSDVWDGVLYYSTGAHSTGLNDLRAGWVSDSYVATSGQGTTSVGLADCASIGFKSSIAASATPAPGTTPTNTTAPTPATTPSSNQPDIGQTNLNQPTSTTPDVSPDPTDSNGLDIAWTGSTDSRINIMVNPGTNVPTFASETPDTLNQSSNINIGLSITPFNGKLYVAYVDADENVYIGYYQKGQKDLQADTVIQDPVSADSPGNQNPGGKVAKTLKKPAITSFNNKLYVAWVDATAANIRLESAVNPADANEFKNNEVVLTQTAKAGPALTVFNNQLHLTYPGTDSKIYTGVYDETKHTLVQSALANQLTATDVTSTATAGELIVAWISDNDAHKVMYASVDDSAHAKTLAPLGATESQIGAALTTYQNQAYALWSEKSQSDNLYVQWPAS